MIRCLTPQEGSLLENGSAFTPPAPDARAFLDAGDWTVKKSNKNLLLGSIQWWSQTAKKQKNAARRIRDTWDYVEPTRIIQDDLPAPGPWTEIAAAKFLLPHKVPFTGLGGEDVDIFRGHYAADHGIQSDPIRTQIRARASSAQNPPTAAPPALPQSAGEALVVGTLPYTSARSLLLQLTAFSPPPLVTPAAAFPAASRPSTEAPTSGPLHALLPLPRTSQPASSPGLGPCHPLSPSSEGPSWTPPSL
ncbi:uncharacterized protein LOC118996490 [Sturnira hondurensis]|uniref:uncharacterized protein LOC118996490 n=1 Tax=Sturnira hondurensis TaxID=192404 RepID=UPI00187976B0|nr:uncharacterized protein LOC118996490 [Sturnira hondurensis]